MISPIIFVERNQTEDDERAGDSVMKSEVQVYALGGRGGFLCIVAEERGVFGGWKV